MGRQRREWELGGLYHLYPCGNNGRELFKNDLERREFLEQLMIIFAAFDVTILGYCLMDTHLHLIVRSGSCGLSGAMQKLLGGYSKGSNRRHGCKGHLFQNRFKFKPIVSERHFWRVARYVDMNPVEAGMCERPEDWEWSSYRAHVGLAYPEPFLDNAQFLKFFAKTPERGYDRYRGFIDRWEPKLAA